MLNIKLEIIVFVCGAVTMVLELVGSRVTAPYFGSTTYTWTGLIGVILASLSLGYYYGGRIADKRANYSFLSLLLLLSAFYVLGIILVKDTLLTILVDIVPDIRISAIIGSAILFSPVSILLGMISPYAVKLRMSSLEKSASTVGNLSAVSTVGSIIGTFLTGFFLLTIFRTDTVLLLASLTLFFLSWFGYPKGIPRLKLIFILLCTAMFLSVTSADADKKNRGIIDTDTAYSRIIIYDTTDPVSKKTIRVFTMNKQYASAMILGSDELFFDYARYYDLAKHFKPDFNRTLLLGGAAYSYPKYFLSRYPMAKMDVVEIDPMVTELAKKYFKLVDNPRLTIYHDDARIFLNRNKSLYDVIYCDAFNTRFSIPFTLTTVENVRHMYDSLEKDGLVIVNLISGITGEKGLFLQALYNTYKSIYPHVYVFRPTAADPADAQNIILLARKSYEPAPLISENEEMQTMLSTVYTGEIDRTTPILTDDLAPVDFYMEKLFPESS